MCFRVMYEVLVCTIIQQELNEGVSLILDLKEKLRTPSTSTQEEHKIINDELESYAEFSSVVIQAFEKVEKSNSAMGKYWLSFRKLTEMLMLNIHAVKT